MATERYVLLGIGRPRAAWFSRVGQWATSGAIPADFVRCVSAQEVRSRLNSGRTFSAVIAEGGQIGVDRDLLATVREFGVPTIVVDGAGGRDWSELGAAGLLPPEFTRDDLLDALDVCAAKVGGDPTSASDLRSTDVMTATPGRVVTVIGGGGVGASTTAIAVAQGLAADAPARGVVLADFCRRADQAMLHDSRVVIPGIQELVEAHRHERPSPEAVRTETFAITERGYRLLLGLRRPRQWVALRPAPFAAAFESLQRTFDLVVCDVEGDLEGETETGSVDVEERHLMARMAVTHADVVVVVARADLQGTHTIVRLVLDLIGVGVATSRMVPVFTHAPRSPRERADVARSLAALVATARGAGAEADMASPVFVPDKRVALALRDGVALPSAVVDPVAGAVRALLARNPTSVRSGSDNQPQPIQPGQIFFTHQDHG